MSAALAAASLMRERSYAASSISCASRLSVLPGIDRRPGCGVIMHTYPCRRATSPNRAIAPIGSRCSSAGVCRHRSGSYITTDVCTDRPGVRVRLEPGATRPRRTHDGAGRPPSAIACSERNAAAAISGSTAAIASIVPALVTHNGGVGTA